MSNNRREAAMAVTQKLLSDVRRRDVYELGMDLSEEDVDEVLLLVSKAEVSYAVFVA